jgi:hypothetical protein
MFVVRSQRWYFSGKASTAVASKRTSRRRLHGIGGLLSQLASSFFEALHSLLLGTGLKNLVEEIFHLVLAIRRRLVEYIALEVGLATTLYATREAGTQSLLQSLGGVESLILCN